jgi:hypothetical protein
VGRERTVARRKCNIRKKKSVRHGRVALALRAGALAFHAPR